MEVNITVPRTVTCLALLLLATISFESALCDEAKVERNVDLGKDPRSFASAEDMHRTAVVSSFTPSAAQLVTSVTASIDADASLESPPVWEALLQLNRFRMAKEVQTAVPRWVERAAGRIGARPRVPADASAFESANRSYRTDLAKAVDQYLKVLEDAPHDLDARNNLALAEAHLGNDLIAQVELEVCRRLYSEYVPALVNLTVVYERLGLFDQAASLAKEAVSKERNLASASYNAAWYYNVSGNYQAAMGQLDALTELGSKQTSKRDMLEQLNTRQFWGSAPLHRKGFAGLCGARNSTQGRVVGVVIFLIGTVIWIRLMGRLGSQASYGNEGTTGFWTCLPTQAVWYLFLWGLPLDPGAWALLICSTLLASIIAAGVAKS